MVKPRLNPDFPYVIRYKLTFDISYASASLDGCANTSNSGSGIKRTSITIFTRGMNKQKLC